MKAFAAIFDLLSAEPDKTCIVGYVREQKYTADELVSITGFKRKTVVSVLSKIKRSGVDIKRTDSNEYYINAN